MFYELDNDYIEFCNDDNPWIEINNDEDIENFNKNFTFHDTYIESIMYASGVTEPDRYHTLTDNSHNMIITFTCWGTRFEILFTRVRRFSLQGFNERMFNEADGFIEFRTDLWGITRNDRVIVWGHLYIPQKINLKDDNATYVIADGLKWRFVK